MKKSLYFAGLLAIVFSSCSLAVNDDCNSVSASSGARAALLAGANVSDSADDLYSVLTSGENPISSEIIEKYGKDVACSGFGDLTSEDVIFSNDGTTYTVGKSDDKKNSAGFFKRKVLKDAIKNLKPGYTLVLEDGDYECCAEKKDKKNEYEAIELNGIHGKPDNWITIKAKNEGKAVLHGKNFSGSEGGKAIIKLNDCSYVKFEGLVFCDASAKRSSKGIHITPFSHHIAITNCKFTKIKTTMPTGKDENDNHGSAHGICVWGDDPDDSIHDILIKNNEFYDMETGYSECITVSSNCVNVNIVDNKLTNTGNIGIDVGGNYGNCKFKSGENKGQICYEKDFARYIYIAGNEFNGCNSPNAMADAIYCDGGQHIIIEKNKIFSGQSGISINSEQKVARKENWPGDIIVRNNKIENTTHRAFGCGSGRVERNAAVMHVLFTKNTCKNNGTKDGEKTIMLSICKDVQIVENSFSFEGKKKKNPVGYKPKDYKDETKLTEEELKIIHQDIIISDNTWTNIANPEKK